MPGEAGLAERRTAESRVEAIGERLATLRARTGDLAVRATDAQERARLTRSSSGGCTHAAEAAAMQEALAEVEHELAGLRTAMDTRGVIEQAKGMLMLHKRCDADAASDVLVELSQTSHRKLVDVAGTLVATWSSGNA